MVGIFDLPRLGNSYDNGALVHLLEATGVPAYELNEVIDTLDAHDGGAPQTVTASDNIIYDDIDFIVSGSLRSNPSPGRRLDDVYNVKQILTQKLIDNRVGGASSIPADAFAYAVQRSAGILGANLGEREIGAITRELMIEEGDGAGIMPRYYSETFADSVAAYLSDRFPGMIPASGLGAAAKAVAISFDQRTHLAEPPPTKIADPPANSVGLNHEPLYLASMSPHELNALFRIIADNEEILKGIAIIFANDPAAHRYIALLGAELKNAGLTIYEYNEGNLSTIARLAPQLQNIQTLLRQVPESLASNQQVRNIGSSLVAPIAQALANFLPSVNGAASVVAPVRAVVPQAGAVAGFFRSAYTSWNAASGPAKATIVGIAATLVFLGIVVLAEVLDR